MLGPEGKGQRLGCKRGLALESCGLGFSPSSATDSLRVRGQSPPAPVPHLHSKVFGLKFS